MKRLHLLCALGGLALLLSAAFNISAQPETIIVIQDAGPKKDKDAGPPKKMDDGKKKAEAPAPPPLEIPELASQLELNAVPANTAPEMLGDVNPLGGFFRRKIAQQPIIQRPFGGLPVLSQGVSSSSDSNVVIPRLRGFKVADNGSAIPQDRVFVTWNYYNDMFRSMNLSLGGNLSNINWSRETFGVERTFFDGMASVELRLPLDTLSASGPGGSSTAVGDLGIVLKYLLRHNPETGDALSAGLAIVTPTGPNNFGGFNAGALGLHSTTLQPYVGFLLNGERFYIHGFSEIDIPTNNNDVTLWYNDIGIGYWLYQRSVFEGPGITSIAPTFEVHVTTPLNHRNFSTFTDPAGTPDVVDLTAGVNIEFNERTRFTFGAVVPVTGPRPYNVEVLTQFRMRF